MKQQQQASGGRVAVRQQRSLPVGAGRIGRQQSAGASKHLHAGDPIPAPRTPAHIHNQPVLVTTPHPSCRNPHQRGTKSEARDSARPTASQCVVVVVGGEMMCVGGRWAVSGRPGGK